MKYLGLDIGGTNLKYSLYDDGMNELVSDTVPSNARCGAQELLKTVFCVCDRHKFDCIGVSTAGVVAYDGSIEYANDNIPHYTGVRLKDVLSDRYGVPVYVLNDIAAGAYAETSENRRDFYYMALGTGVGGMYVKDGVAQLGENRIAGQIGYLRGGFRNDIIDNSASVFALEKYGGADGKSLFLRAANGDLEANFAIEQWSREIMYVVGLIIGFFDPKEIVIGGAVSRQGEKLLSYLIGAENVLPEPYKNKASFTTATHTDMAGVIGAVKYAMGEYYERKR